MNVSRQPRLRTLAVTTALVATVLATGAMSQTARASAPAAAPAAPSTGSASGFFLYVIPDPQPTCILPLGLGATDDPAIDRKACAFTEFTVSETTGTISGDLYGEGETTPFATVNGVQDTTDDSIY